MVSDRSGLREPAVFAAIFLLAMPLVPFAPAMLGIWGASLLRRMQLPLSVKLVRWTAASVAVFAACSAACEFRWGHDVVTDYGDVWFDNLCAGLIVPGGVVVLTSCFLWAARDPVAWLIRYRRREQARTKPF